MAMDGQPAEPFPARNGALVLAPGARADAFVDAATSAPFLLHDGKEARQIGRLAVSGWLERRAPLFAAAAPAFERPSREARSERRPAVRCRARRTRCRLDPASKFLHRRPPPPSAPRPAAPSCWPSKNPGPVTNVFHLHGHHFRLLDRLDDGWKPYWLDTLAIEPGQTQRIAFAATSPGRWLIESVVTDWAAPRLVRWYAVE